MVEKGTSEVPVIPVEPVEPVEPVIPVEPVTKCKSCGSELKRILFNSRAENPLYIYLCNNTNCNLYRQPQGYDGELPLGMKIPMV